MHYDCLRDKTWKTCKKPIENPNDITIKKVYESKVKVKKKKNRWVWKKGQKGKVARKSKESETNKAKKETKTGS